MGERIKFTVINSNREQLINMIRNAPSGTEIEIRHGVPHTIEQRAKMRCMLRDISKQCTWYGVKFPEDVWKNIFTAEVRRDLVFPDIHGAGYVLMGDSTKEMLIEEMASIIDLMHAFGDEHGVKFKGDSLPSSNNQIQ